MRQFDVSGMSCSACSTRVEKAVSKLEGVSECSVSLLMNSMSVEGEATDEAIIEAVSKAGYLAKVKSTRISVSSVDDRACSEQDAADTKDTDINSDLNINENSIRNSEVNNDINSELDIIATKEANLIRNRIIVSIIVLVGLMYISMGHSMWGWPVPKFLDKSPVLIGLVQLVLTTIVLIINKKFFINGYKSLWYKAPNMDTLVALGSSAAYVYSTVVLVLLANAVLHGDEILIHKYMHEFYFESAAMIVTLISVGKMLEARAKGKTTKAIKSLMDLAPKMATIIRDGKEVTISASEVKVGDIYVIRPGESIPVDGVIVKGHTSIDESALSGESIPVDKVEGSQVSAATINKEGYIECRATKVGEDTTLSQIIKVVTEAVATKAPIAKVADTVSGVFVPVVMGISLITTLIWIFAGESIGFALARGISVLVISCPCALGLATPVAIMVGSGMGAKHGIMFKNAISLEQAGRATVVALDKTGTITKGEPTVTDIVVAEGVSQDELLSVAYSLEVKSEHPLSKAVISYVEDKCIDECLLEKNGIERNGVEDFSIIPGKGLSGMIQGEAIYGGNYEYIINDVCSMTNRTKWDINNKEVYKKLVKMGQELSEQGKTLLYFAKETKVLGFIAVADVIKNDSNQAIKELQELGIKVVMLTGDNAITAKAIGDIAGVDEVIAGVLPDEKAKVIKQLQEKSKVIMVGDGINDAPALVQADVGIAIGAGTDVAIESADVVLMKNTLIDVVAAIRLSRNTLKNIHENLFWAFIYNIIGIPLAAGVWIHIWGWKLNPMFGALAMSLSSFCVVSNALRLNLCKMYKNFNVEENVGSVQGVGKQEVYIEKEHISYKDNTDKKNNNTEDVIMKKVIKIEGMMCKHCEARVKKVLEGVEGISEALVSHENDEAIVTMSKEIGDDVLTKLIEDEDYKVIEIIVK